MTKTSIKNRIKRSSEGTIDVAADQTKKRSVLKTVVAYFLLLIILGVTLHNTPVIVTHILELVDQQTTSSTPNPSPTQPPLISSPTPSTIKNEEMVNHALSLINEDRLEHGLSNVSLSSIRSGQEHADNMLEQGFFSHWDIKGYKPYMRYSLVGGQGFVSENVAWSSSTGPINVKKAIDNLEWKMMYEDAMWNWGHRDNILNPFHNKVSIGIAYDNHNLYLVQDFENDYVDWATFFQLDEENDVTIDGRFIVDEVPIEAISIFFDLETFSLTSGQLEEPPYNGAYSFGSFVGMILPPRYESVEGITITAKNWIQRGGSFQIESNLSSAFNSFGYGIYTLCLIADSNYFTSYSIWYSTG